MIKRYYTLCGVVYDDNLACLDDLFGFANHYVAIVHDRDDRDTHIHFICTFPQNLSFEGAKKRIHSNGNAFVQPVEDLPGMFAYLTHCTSQAVTDGKYQYSHNDLVSDNIQYWYDRVAEPDRKNNNADFVRDLLAPDINIRDMGLKYGRDFIKNMRHYLAFRRAVLLSEPDYQDLLPKAELHAPTYDRVAGSPGWVTLSTDNEFDAPAIADTGDADA